MATVRNDDVAYINDKLCRFAGEVYKSQAADVSGFNPFDQQRLNQYLDSVDAATSYVVAQPQLDLPESSPQDVPTADFPQVTDTENDEVDQVLRMLKRSHVELVNSQSARNAAGLIGFDESRLRALVQKCRNFLNDYIASQTPQDLPETSPQSATAGAGRTGINPS